MIRSKKFVIMSASVCAAALALAGCGSTGTLPDPSSISNTVATLEAAVAAITGPACQLVPTAVTIAGMVTANPALKTAADIASAICSVVPKTSAKTSSVARAMRKLLRGDTSGVAVIGSYVAPNGQVVPVQVYQ